LKAGLIAGADGRVRCGWSGTDPLYQRYHDLEWGRPMADNVRLFEKLCLEGFQSGLSWITILRKRENFRAAFRGFEIETVAAFGARDVTRLLEDAGIVRHRGKIESTLGRFYWAFEPPVRERKHRLDWATLRTLGQTDASNRLSKALRRRGFSFVGPTTAYAFMQAMGLVNDHIEGCAVRAVVEEERARFKRPRPLRIP
jgi:DNA-3-methyladenine glycosylase I